MLLLNRRIGEAIIIGDNITVTVLAVRRGNQVQLAINAPKHISVHREEIYKRIKDQEAADEIGSTIPNNKDNVH